MIAINNITYNQFIEILSKYDKFEAKDLKLLYEKYGKNRINEYFEEYYQKLDEEEISKFIIKYSVYFENQTFESDNVISNTAGVGSTISMLINNSVRYSIMNPEFEYQQGLILNECKKKLTIVKNINDEKILYPDLKIEKILLSVKSKKELDTIALIKKLPYSLDDESILKNDQDIIRKFLKFSSDRILTIDELKRLFSNLNFDDVEPVDDLLDQLELLKKYIMAKFNFYNRNLRLVISIAKNCSSKFPLEDRIQEGYIGLIRAINRYDASKGYKFSTYASWWVKQNINRAIASKADIITKPVHLFEKIKKYERFVQKYLSIYGVEPSINECAIELGISEEEVLNLQLLSLNLVSLNSPIKNGSNESSDELMDFILEDRTSIEDEIVFNDISNSILKEINSFANEKQKQVLIDRMGLNDDEVIYTLQEIANRYGISRERVRQIEEKGKKRLIYRLKSKGIFDID